MKKFAALLIALTLTLCACCAMAEDLWDCRLTVTLPDTMVELELDEEDIEEGCVAMYMNEDETLAMEVLLFDAEETLEELEAALKEEIPEAQIGITNINGIDALYCAYKEDGERVIAYFIIDDDVELDIYFYFMDDEGGMLSGQIMNTLSK